MVTRTGTKISKEAQPAKQKEIHAVHHRIVKGDTLYSIAWRYKLDYRELARWNRIQEPYLIYPGKILHLLPPKKMTSELKVKPSNPTPEYAIVKKKTTPKKRKERGTNFTPATTRAIQWVWPTQGTLLTLGSPTAKKGIDISGRHGQKIIAAAPGEVVYSGSGLLNYGKTIIIKHDAVFLSAYAYNSELLVEEGEYVRKGQTISHMGTAYNNKTLLHFEIRKNGRPIDPLKILPP